MEKPTGETALRRGTTVKSRDPFSSPDQPGKAKLPGKGLQEKRVRLLRCLDAHIRYLEMIERLHPWYSPPRQERPPRPADPFPYRADMRGRYVSPREKPALRFREPGPDEMSEEIVKAWVEIDPFIRGGLSRKTQAAMAYIATFEPKRARG